VQEGRGQKAEGRRQKVERLIFFTVGSVVNWSLISARLYYCSAAEITHQFKKVKKLTVKAISLLPSAS
jgi:hypothetical protein